MQKWFIVMEGVDCSGKTTLGRELSDKLLAEYIHSPPEEIKQLREIADKGSPEGRFHYYLWGNHLASDKIKRTILDRSVVLDRYVYSTVAYHSAHCRRDLNIHEKNLLQPDLIVLATADWDVIEQRLTKRGDTPKIPYLQEVMRQFDRILAHNPKAIRVDTSTAGHQQTLQEITQHIYGN